MKQLKALGGYYLIFLVIMLISRSAFICLYIHWHDITDNSQDLPLAIYNAIRFDALVIAYLMIIPTIITPLYAKFNRVYIPLGVTCLSLLSFIDLGFYHNFNSHINITIFDFFNEGPAGIISTIWDEYPVISLIFVLIIISFLSFKSVLFIERKTGILSARITIPSKKTSLVTFIYLLFITLSLRGSITEFPLQIEDTIVSTCQALNNAVPNPPYMLKVAIKHKQNMFHLEELNAIAQNNGFQSIEDAIKAFNISANININNQTDTLKLLESILFTHNSTNPQHKPNVLIIISESWSGYLTYLDSKESELLFDMKKHFKEDLLWRNFESVTGATISTIENMIVSTRTFERFFESKYAYNVLPTSIALPFNANRYSTEFITGMDLAWSNCYVALKAQDFKKITGKYELLKENPGYKYNSVGVYDHHLLKSIMQRLTTKSLHPQMMLAMTTTNHPPFIFPDDISIPEPSTAFFRKKDFNDVGKDILIKYIRGFQYYNKVLGEFLNEFKASPAADNTIIVITGDHNVRSILNYDFIGAEWQMKVPIYIYIPRYLRNGLKYPDESNKHGDHYNILPTIAPYIFDSNTKYLKLSNSLFDNNESSNIAARNTLLKLYITQLLKKNQPELRK